MTETPALQGLSAASESDAEVASGSAKSRLAPALSWSAPTVITSTGPLAGPQASLLPEDALPCGQALAADGEALKPELSLNQHRRPLPPSLSLPKSRDFTVTEKQSATVLLRR